MACNASCSDPSHCTSGSCTNFSCNCCTGNNPANASMCTGDNDPSANTAKALVATCSAPAGSAPKCEFTCNSGYVLSGGVCVPDCIPHENEAVWTCNNWGACSITPPACGNGTKNCTSKTCIDNCGNTCPQGWQAPPSVTVQMCSVLCPPASPVSCEIPLGYSDSTADCPKIIINSQGLFYTGVDPTCPN